MPEGAPMAAAVAPEAKFVIRRTAEMLSLRFNGL
jgi:hypothetical protein